MVFGRPRRAMNLLKPNKNDSVLTGVSLVPNPLHAELRTRIAPPRFLSGLEELEDRTSQSL